MQLGLKFAMVGMINPGLTVGIYKVRSHIGVAGNAAADRLARQAAEAEERAIFCKLRRELGTQAWAPTGHSTSRGLQPRTMRIRTGWLTTCRSRKTGTSHFPEQDQTVDTSIMLLR